MIWAALILMADVMPPAGPDDEFPSLPPLSSLKRFPEVESVWFAHPQLELCQQHVARLQHLQRYTPLRLDAAIAETRWRAEYWGLLYLARHADYSEEFHRLRLDDLRRLIGRERFDAGWRPPAIPEGLPCYERPAPARPPANNS